MSKDLNTNDRHNESGDVLTGRALSSNGSVQALDDESDNSHQQNSNNNKTDHDVSPPLGPRRETGIFTKSMMNNNSNNGNTNRNKPSAVPNEPASQNDDDNDDASLPASASAASKPPKNVGFNNQKTNNSSSQQHQQQTQPPSRNPMGKRHGHSRTISGGIMGNLGTTGLLPPPASLSRAPRIVREEKERRERAAQEMLWMGGQRFPPDSVAEQLPTSSSSSSANHHHQLMTGTPQGGVVGQSPQATATSFGSSSHPTLHHHTQGGTGTNQSSTNQSFNPSFAIQNNNHPDHVSQGRSSERSHSNHPAPLQASNFPQHRQLQVEFQEHKREETTLTNPRNNNNNNSAQPLTSKNYTSASYSEGLDLAGRSKTYDGNYPSHMMMNENNNNQPSVPASPNHQRHKSSKSRHDREPSNLEFFVKTTHGGHNRASVKFDAQQESMALAALVGHHHQNYNNNQNYNNTRRGSLHQHFQHQPLHEQQHHRRATSLQHTSASHSRNQSHVQQQQQQPRPAHQDHFANFNSSNDANFKLPTFANKQSSTNNENNFEDDEKQDSIACLDTAMQMEDERLKYNSGTDVLKNDNINSGFDHQQQRGHHASPEFNEEQLAAIQAFSGLPVNAPGASLNNNNNPAVISPTSPSSTPYEPNRQHVRGVSSKFYTKPSYHHSHSRHHERSSSQQAKAMSSKQNSSQNALLLQQQQQQQITSPTKSSVKSASDENVLKQQQHQQQQQHTSEEGEQQSLAGSDTQRSGVYTTPTPQQEHSDHFEDSRRKSFQSSSSMPKNPLAGGIINTSESLEPSPKNFDQTMTMNNNSGDTVAPAHPASSSSSSTDEPNIVYAGFGPRQTIEVPSIPYDSAWKQHTLPSIRFELSLCGHILMMTLVVCTCFPIGALLFAESDAAERIDIRYDQISKYRYPKPYNTTLGDSDSEKGHYSGFLRTYQIKNDEAHRQGVKTLLRFNLTKKLKAPISMSYGMTRMYQNHLNVFQSRSLVNLAGANIASDLDITNCNPILTPGSLRKTDEEQLEAKKTAVDDLSTGDPAWKLYQNFMYHPCGSLPWSMFNDTFSVFKVPEGEEVTEPENYKWSSFLEPSTNRYNFSEFKFFSRDDRFDFLDHNGSTQSFFDGNSTLICNSSDFDASGNRISLDFNSNPCEKSLLQLASDRSRFGEINYDNEKKYNTMWMNTKHRAFNTSNIFLKNGWYADEPGHELPFIFDIDFQVWMRVSPLSTFRKPLRIIFRDMEPGQYQIEVDEYFDSTSYGGEKYLSFESRKSLVTPGGQNYALAIFHQVVGGIAAVLLAFFVGNWVVINVFNTSKNNKNEKDKKKKNTKKKGASSTVKKIHVVENEHDEEEMKKIDQQ